MATLTHHRFTVDEYEQMIDMGILAESECVELIHGEVVEKMVVGPMHSATVNRINRLLTTQLLALAIVSVQNPIVLNDSEPEPDLAIVLGPDTRYDDNQPTPRDVLLIVEVSDSSLEEDRGEKLQSYAAARIPCYWVVNLRANIVEVYTLPRGGRNPTYRSRVDYAAGMAVPVVVAGNALGTISVDEILP